MYCELLTLLVEELGNCVVLMVVLGELVSTIESGREYSMCGGFCDPERAASDAEREPEPSLWSCPCWRNALCSCASYSGPKYCDNNTVLRFSYLVGSLAVVTRTSMRQDYEPLLGDITLLELIVKRLQFGLQFGIRLGHDEYSDGCATDQVKRVCEVAVRHMSRISRMRERVQV